MPAIQIDGLSFHVAERGAGDPVILLHGFTGSSESWQAIADCLATTCRVLTIDIIGHGRSDAPDDRARYDFVTALGDLDEIAKRLDGAPAVWVGYSMGGRLALGLAVRYPDLVSALILESASPGIASAIERASRRATDEALARRIAERGMPAFVAEWERLPLWESQRSLEPAPLERQRAIRLDQRAVGLANSLRGMGQGAQPALWDRLQEIRIPTLLLAGARDEKYAAIARQMAAELPRAELRIVPEAGHAIHLERPERYAELVTEFVHRSGHRVAQFQEGRTTWT